MKYVLNGFLYDFDIINGSLSKYNIKDMRIPVLCTYCSKTYDLTKVKVTHRYSDCDQFKSPCCDRLVDTRMYKNILDFKYLNID